MTKSSTRWTMLLALTTLAFSSVVWAHHSPSEVVEALSRRIASGHHTASLLVRRGDEYRAMGNEESATADYRSALELKPENLSALYGLARAHFSQRLLGKAQMIADRGVEASHSADEAGRFHALLARIHEKQEDWETALAAWRRSIASSRPDINWFLGEARTLSKLNRHDDARLSLESAIQRNPSAVLRRAWIKTLIDCGKANEASPHIEAGLARSRWKSSWLLLRAQLKLSQNQLAAAKRDAEQTLREIDTRWNANTANPFLAADRERALAMLKSFDETSISGKQTRANGRTTQVVEAR